TAAAKAATSRCQNRQHVTRLHLEACRGPNRLLATGRASQTRATDSPWLTALESEWRNAAMVRQKSACERRAKFDPPHAAVPAGVAPGSARAATDRKLPQ